MSGKLVDDSYSEKQMIAATRAQDIAFVTAMMRAIKRNKVSVAIGTFVDDTPTFARAIRGDPLMGSGCGSPAAMCAESGAAPGDRVLR